MGNPLVGVIKDTHITSKNIDIVKDIFSQFIFLLLQKKITNAIHLGDFFSERRNGHNVDRLTAVKEIIEMFETAKITLYAIQGNHDLQDLEGHIGYMDVYTNSYFQLTHGYEFVDIATIRFHLVPYLLEGNIYLEQLHKAQYSKKLMNILCSHVAVNGVRNNDGSIVATGLSVSEFKNFDKVLLGHYHDESFIKPNVYYLSGCFQQNFGEDQKKGFTIVYDDGSLKFFPSIFKKYYKLKIEATNKKELQEIYLELKDMDFNEVNVRLILTGSEQEFEGIDASIFKELGVDVKYENTKETLVNFENIGDLELITFTKDQLIKNFEEFAKELEYTPRQYTQGLQYLKLI